MGRIIREIFRIDKLGNPWIVRIMFAFLAFIKCGIEILPICDHNFDEFFGWVNSMLNHPELLNNIDVSSVPLSKGNIVYIILSLISDLMIIAAGYLYMAIFIKAVRQKNNMPNVISWRKIFARLFILCLLTIILALPLSFVLLYLSLIFIIIFPCMIMLPACYLSGDSSLIHSFRDCAKRTKGYYLINARTISIIVLINFVAELIMMAIGNKAPALVMVLSTFIGIYTVLILFRYVGIIYLRMIAIPGNTIIVRVNQSQTSDTNNNSEVKEAEGEIVDDVVEEDK